MYFCGKEKLTCKNLKNHKVFLNGPVNKAKQNSTTNYVTVFRFATNLLKEFRWRYKVFMISIFCTIIK